MYYGISIGQSLFIFKSIDIYFLGNMGLVFAKISGMRKAFITWPWWVRSLSWFGY